MLLPDINVWLPLAFDVHIHHAASKKWFDVQTEELCFCRHTQQGFLRLATNPRVFKDKAVSLSRAWELYDTMLRDERISFLDEPSGIEPYWRNYTQLGSFSPQLWSDAYLAAFARTADLTLITFDRDFSRFKDLKCTFLS